jgi:hypothetical protein
MAHAVAAGVRVGLRGGGKVQAYVISSKLFDRLRLVLAEAARAFASVDAVMSLCHLPLLVSGISDTSTKRED